MGRVFARDAAHVRIWQQAKVGGKCTFGQAGALRQAVTSPGGTTAAALNVLEQAGFTTLWNDALAAAEARGRELGRG